MMDAFLIIQQRCHAQTLKTCLFIESISFIYSTINYLKNVNLIVVIQEMFSEILTSFKIS
jgi:hypothetical protein